MTGYCDPRVLYARASGVLRKRQLLNRPSTWAEHRGQIDFPSGQPIPGPLKIDRFPPMRGVMDAMGVLDPCTMVVLMCSAQSGKTQAYQLALGERIDEHPTTALVVLPDDSAIKEFATKKWRPLVKASSRLRAKLDQPGFPSNIHQSGFLGGEITFAGSAGADTYRTDTYEIVILDDLDAFQRNPEGDHLELAMGRTTMYRLAARKVIAVSSPRLKDGPIDTAWQASSQELWHVPCLACDAYQVLELTSLNWTPGMWGTAHFLCVHCDERIHQGQIKAMNKRGRWVAKHPERMAFCRGFHVGQANAPFEFADWSDFAKAMESADRAFEKNHDESIRQAVTNTRAGLPYESVHNKRLDGEAAALFQLREQPWDVSTLPIQVRTAGCDPGGKGLDTFILGTGFRDERWVLDHKVHTGNIRIDHELWDAWADWIIASKVDAVCVDAGWEQDKVCKQVTRLAMKFGEAGIYVWTIKGDEGDKVLWPGRIDFGNYKMGPMAPGDVMRPVLIRVDAGKSEVYGSLSKTCADDAPRSGPGIVHVSTDRKKRFFNQLYGERRVNASDKVGKRTSWVKRHKTQRVEVLDGFVYSLAALDGLVALRPDLGQVLLGSTPAVVARPAPRPTASRPQPVEYESDSPW